MLKLIGIVSVCEVGVFGRAPLAYYKDLDAAKKRADAENETAEKSNGPRTFLNQPAVGVKHAFALKAEDESGHEILFALSPILPVDR
jgi:predicted HD phosphohydrolase